MLHILKKRIGCAKFLALIKNFIKISCTSKNKFDQFNSEFFQKNITALILNNIYLHEFDFFMQSLSKLFLKTSTSHTNIISNTNNSDFKRLYYLRYINNCIIGIVGSRKDAIDVQTKIQTFLCNVLKLTLDKNKTLLINFSEKSIKFLGVYIKSI